MCPTVMQRAPDQECDTEADRRVRKVERDVAEHEWVRNAAAPGETADDGRERTACGEAASERDDARADARRQREQRDPDHEPARVDDRRALVREHARLQQVVDDRRRDDGER
jgi:hypothetical protein